MKKTLWVAVLWAACSGSASAFLGIGDVTFDPPVHAELISLFDQTMAIYRTTMSELHRMEAVEAALQTAQRDVKAITNGNLIHYEETAMPVGIPPSIGQYFDAAQGITQTATDLSGYYQQQVRRVQQLTRLNWLVRATSEDARLSATRLGAKTSGDVTAQSSATVATLAVQSAQSMQARAIRRAAERRNERRLPEQALPLYEAFGQAP
ncbi:MAG TPA: hypothetical protein VMV40_02235 [Acidiferrobacter sp.]|nr:hypothetical protein [Acidiferrobacter sp.]